MRQDTILIVDLGSTENSVLARMIRAMGVYSEICPHDITPEDLDRMPQVKGLIFAGGSNRLIDGVPAMPDEAVVSGDIPSLAIGCEDMPEINIRIIDEGVIRHFVFEKCHCSTEWNMKNFVKEQIRLIREQVGSEQVLLALSGGVDSSVVAAMLIQAIGDQLTCIHVNHGLLRKGESEEVVRVFRDELGAHLVYVDAVDRFLDKLAGVLDPEQKRKIIGAEFIRVFEEEATKLKGIRFLGQGTIYPDIVESGTKTAKAIKAHHNVGGLPEDLKFELVEPVKYLYKDEVRACGVELGLPESMVYRQPFPGPGLGVRCLGAITRERLEAVRESDAILREEFRKAGLEGKVWQYFTAIPDFKSVGVRDHARSFEYPVIIRAVNTVDAMTASVATPDWPILQKITFRIINEVKGVNRVVYDLTPKPTGTIEWE
ncbi:MAG: glutamine-hydrolyzing GMP synthase [Clostridiales bacterium]|nr:glutamine-hydrolyzing GMP synthase [Clostridiales bacterium]